jgi:hypothetical protein
MIVSRGIDMPLANDPIQEKWLSDQIAKLPPGHDNPCVARFGRRDPAEKCKHCRLFIRKHYSKTYFKCQLRGDTNGPATDHRANWAACKRFEPINQQTKGPK